MRTNSTGTRVAAATAALLLGAGLVACTDDETPEASGFGGSDPVVDEDRPFLGVRSATAPTALQAGQSCDEVLEDFQAIASPVLESQFGFGPGGMAVEESTDDMAGDMAGDDASAAAPATTSALGRTGDAIGGDGEAGATSGTNTQEEGIDEPDTVETDGEVVYVVDGQELIVLDGATAEVLGRTDLGTHGSQIMRSGDRILAIAGGGYGGFPGGPPIAAEPAIDLVDPALSGPVPDEAPADEVPVEPGPIPVEPPSFHAGTVIQLVDVADPAAPRVIQTTEIEGSHVDTRVVDGVARIVVTSYPETPALHEATIESQDDARDVVANVVGDTTIDDWLPAFRTSTRPDAGAPSSIEGTLVDCEDVLVPEVNAGITETSVLRVDFDEGFDPANTTTIVAEPGAVYASASTLYLAATRWVTPDEQGRVAGDDWSTAVHAFDLTGDGAATHAAAGEVPGSTLNQFSMSEHEGNLRIATTEGTPWGRTDSESGVHVLARQGSELVEIGAVGGLGVTETIQSVRFMGPVGYVVTFRQTDPLYVIDLADPTNPRNVGELKIPGFSSYLHPIGDDRLIGVGRDADEEGVDQGFLLSLFDVSDPTNPQQLQTWTAPEAWSSAGSDPQAFLWWAPETAAILPLDRYEAPTPNEPEGNRSGITVFDVADDGITERATVTAGGSEGGGRYASRALVVQGRLWSIFDGGVVVSRFAQIAEGEFRNFR